MIAEEKLKTVLRETYLEIANKYDVSNLYHNKNKVMCVASRFRRTVLKNLIFLVRLRKMKAK